MGCKIIVLSSLISLLAGCAAKAPVAEKPGVSLALNYPVLLASDRNLLVKDDELNLTTTTVASGVNFPEFKLITADGAVYSIVKVTEFGKKSTFMDMGTSQFRVFLELKRDPEMTLQTAKAFVLGVALSPNGDVSGERGAAIARKRIDGCKSFAELVEACRKTWEWR
jgi:hypothetical protein